MRPPISSLDGLLKPASIAIIGASETTGYASGPIRNLQKFGFKGPVYGVNPKYPEILGIKSYPSIVDIPGPVDLGIYVIGRGRIMPTLEECKKKGVKALLVISAGFAESDDEGKELQKKVTQFARETGIRICGPNCFGVANIKDSVIATPDHQIRPLNPGGVGLVSHSGALGFCTFFHYGSDRRIGFSYVISTGNEADVEMADGIKYLAEDADTKVISVFIEGLKDPPNFLEAAKLALQRDKPIVALKVGRTEAGGKAAVTHTGSLTGSDAVYNAIFKQNAIVRANDLDELMDIAAFFSKCKRPKGDGIGILSSSGGLGSLSADICGELGLNIVDITGTPTQDKLLKIPELLTFGVIRNPADVRGQGIAALPKSIVPFLEDPNIHIIVVACAHCGVGDVSYRVASNIIEIAGKSDKPIIALWTGRKEPDPEETDEKIGIEMLRRSNVPVFDSPRKCYQAIKALLDYIKAREEILTAPIAVAPIILEDKKNELREQLASKSGLLTMKDAFNLLSAYNIPLARGEVAATVDEAKRIAGEIGYPVAVKVDSPQVTHKTDAGALKLNIASGEELVKAYDEVIAAAKRYDPNAQINGVFLQEMVKDGTEALIGVSQDPQFGPSVMFGLGGIFVEVLKDTSLRVPPLSKNDVLSMIKEIKGYKILQGFRDIPKGDVEGVVDTILKISQLSLDNKESVYELDVNPLIVLPEGQGVKAIDARIVIKGH